MPSAASITRPSSQRCDAYRSAARRSQINGVLSSKSECAARAQIVAQKRIPLATKYDVNTNNVVVPSTTLRLPRTLPRPVLGEVRMATLLEAYPHLAGIPAEYIREHLPSSTSTMTAALQAVQLANPTEGLPKELEIIMNDAVSAACPTHMLAVYGDAPTHGKKRQVALFPFHDLVLSLHCSRLPVLPVSRPDTSAGCATVTLPVIPLRLPAPETFALLQSYLYTQQPAFLLAALAPPCEADILQLVAHATKMHGVWRNACALGVVDARLYDILDASWAHTLAAMQACS
ncbi:hypothetical protein B0H15DRAFT_904911 [Mycena belliarum]|uniref:Clp1-like protein n=1 Tax=Mycena belliarum TaxID=1033014 RepID=A0AAD6XRD1_9AGAR|nr:hypothetical protein B0H15DRAFT_904911 [Mycena belliae]